MGKRLVLIVEDERDVAELVKRAVDRTGEVQTVIVASGDEALRAVIDRVPDLVLLDLNLPVLDGVEVCRILRTPPETRHVPIIMLTARGTEEDRVSGLELGADDYIVKPFSLRELAARIRAVLRRAGTRAEAPARVSAAAGTLTPARAG